MKLLLDTSKTETVRVILEKDGWRFGKSSRSHLRRAQALLPLIERLLKEHDMMISDIKAIEINRGPGSFTGLRVGLAIGNSLAWLLGIRINKKPSPAMPRYT